MMARSHLDAIIPSYCASRPCGTTFMFIVFLDSMVLSLHCSCAGNAPFSRYTPSTALIITAEKVLKRSNRPNTDLGMIPVPSAPIIMAARQPIAQILLYNT